MYLERAITRINNINWDKVGTKISTKDGDLGERFLQSDTKISQFLLRNIN